MPYDLLWPVSKRLDTGVEAKVVEGEAETNHLRISSGGMVLSFRLARTSN
jgi:hypothetical protein